MSIVKVNRRRIYIPKDIPFSAKKVLIVPLGSKLMIIPIPEKPIEIDTNKSTEELRKLAERKAKEDSITKHVEDA